MKQHAGRCIDQSINVSHFKIIVFWVRARGIWHAWMALTETSHKSQPLSSGDHGDRTTLSRMLVKIVKLKSFVAYHIMNQSN